VAVLRNQRNPGTGANCPPISIEDMAISKKRLMATPVTA
jgi:hypothetical protein